MSMEFVNPAPLEYKPTCDICDEIGDSAMVLEIFNGKCMVAGSNTVVMR